MKHLWMECPSCGLKYRNEVYDELITQRNELVAALRGLVCAADDLTDGQIDPEAGQSEREFIAAHEAARAAIAKVKEAVDKRMKGE